MNSSILRRLSQIVWLSIGLIVLTGEVSAKPAPEKEKASVTIKNVSAESVRVVISKLNSSDIPCSCKDCQPEVHPCPTCCADNRVMSTSSGRNSVKEFLTPGVYRIDLFRGEQKVGTFRGVELKSGEQITVTPDDISKPGKPDSKTALKPRAEEKPE